MWQRTYEWFAAKMGRYAAEAGAKAREVVRRALELGANALDLVHKRPTRDPTCRSPEIQADILARK